MRKHWLALTLLLACLSWSPLQAGEFDLEIATEAARSTSHFKRNALFLVGAVGILGSQDKMLKNAVPKMFSEAYGSRDWDSHDFGKRGTTIERLGRMPGTAQVAGAFYIGGALTDSVNARRVGVLALEAKVVNDLVTVGLKKAIGRERPSSGKTEGDEFQPFGSSDSFPSGHTASAFALATIVADNHESKFVSFISYGLATAVGLSRVNQGAHWTSDIAGGALVGYGVGKMVSGFERRKGWSSGLYFGGTSIGFRKRFK